MTTNSIAQKIAAVRAKLRLSLFAVKCARRNVTSDERSPHTLQAAERIKD